MAPGVDPIEDQRIPRARNAMFHGEDEPWPNNLKQ
jgi:hypothetical protein